jgi:hypothetical protein
MPNSLLPQQPDQRNIIACLNQTLQKAQAFYGAVCFWSIGPDVLSKSLIGLLGQPGSFCIVDIHTPTNVDKLHLFHANGGTNFYIFAKEVQLKTGEHYLQRHLLHIKMLVFDLPNKQAEIWIGSHNFTKQALHGINREASMIVPCYQGDVIYQQARAYLSSVLADPDCRPFDPKLIDDYKKLQGIPEDELEGGCYVLPLAWDSSRMAALAQQTVTLVGNDLEEGRQLFRVNGDSYPLAIRAYDLSSNSIRHFSAIVQNQGAIDSGVESSYDLAFGPRHLAVRPPGVMPYVAPLEESLTKEVLLEFRFWATIRILDELPELIAWVPVQRNSNAGWEHESETTRALRQEGINWDYYEELAAQTPAFDNYAALQFEDTSATAVNARVNRWLDWATWRAPRTMPGPPEGRHALFSSQRPQRPVVTELDKLTENFRPKNRSQLLSDYEAPIRERYYERTSTDDKLDDKRKPRLENLVKRYRLVMKEVKGAS